MGRPNPRPRLLGAAIAAVVGVASVMSWAVTAAGADPVASSTTTPSPTTSTTLPPASAGSGAPDTTAPPATTTTVLGATTTTLAAGLGATTTTTPATTTTTELGLRVDQVSPAFVANLVNRMQASSAAFASAQAKHADAKAAYDRATLELDGAQKELGALDEHSRAVATALVGAQDRVKNLAVSTYMAGGPASPLSALLGSADVSDFARRRALVDTVEHSDAEALRSLADAHHQAGSAVVKAAARFAAADRAHRDADAAYSAAADDFHRVALQLESDRALLEVGGAAVPADGTDIPRLVLDAYHRAATQVQAQGCRLDWSALAGIGKVESDHGRAQGAHLTLGGELLPPILGITLDGTNGTARIPASDHGEYTGDPAFEHAVGPMQFLPSTWAVIGASAIPGHRPDPNNIYDATLAAARYLCRAAPPATLDSDVGLRQAFFSYNHSNAYVDGVLALAHLYGGKPATASPAA